MAFGKYVAGTAGLNPADYADMDAIVTDSIAMDAVATSSEARDIIWNNSLAWDKVIASNMAVGKYIVGEAGLDPSAYADMDAVANDATARDAIWNSTTAWDKLDASSVAVGKYVAGQAGLDPSAYVDMDALVTDSTAMDTVVNSSTAMDAVGRSSTARDTIQNNTTAWDKVIASNMAVGKYIVGEAGLDPTSYADIDAVTSDSTAMTSIWSVDSARQILWESSVARLSVWNNISTLQAITLTADPDLIDETPLNTDTTAGYLTKKAKTYGQGSWTAVNIDDGQKYIAFIHFRSNSDLDWYEGRIASYDQTTDLQTTTGGADLIRGNLNRTSNGLWVWFKDVDSTYGSSVSYARVWYIQV